MSSPIVEALHLSRKFGDRVVLRDLDLKIDANESVSLSGANGSGKTTLLKILSLLVEPSSGQLRVFDHDVPRALSPAPLKSLRSRIGFAAASDSGFFPRLTGFENLVFFGRLFGVDFDRLQTRIEPWRTLRTFELALQTPHFHCSSGMKQTLTIARALLHSPSLILLDEPTRNLDEETTQAVHEMIRGESECASLVIATHSKEERQLLCSRHLLITEGRLVHAD